MCRRNGLNTVACSRERSACFFTLCLAQLQASLSESLTLRQQNESAVNAMNEQLQQRITIAAWLYEDSRLLRDDINTLFATEHT